MWLWEITTLGSVSLWAVSFTEANLFLRLEYIKAYKAVSYCYELFENVTVTFHSKF